jgi:hypothetical protein
VIPDGAQAPRNPPPPGAEEERDRRALSLAKAHHAAMGQAMREHLDPAYVVADWLAMPKPRRDVMVAVMRDLLDKGVIA